MSQSSDSNSEEEIVLSKREQFALGVSLSTFESGYLASSAMLSTSDPEFISPNMSSESMEKLQRLRNIQLLKRIIRMLSEAYELHSRLDELQQEKLKDEMDD